MYQLSSLSETFSEPLCLRFGEGEDDLKIPILEKRENGLGVGLCNLVVIRGNWTYALRTRLGKQKRTLAALSRRRERVRRRRRE